MQHSICCIYIIYNYEIIQTKILIFLLLTVMIKKCVTESITEKIGYITYNGENIEVYNGVYNGENRLYSFTNCKRRKYLGEN